MSTIHHEHAEDILNTHMDTLTHNAQRAYGLMSGLSVPLAYSFGRPIKPSAHDVEARQIRQAQMIDHLRAAIMAATDALIAIQQSTTEPEA